MTPCESIPVDAPGLTDRSGDAQQAWRGGRFLTITVEHLLWALLLLAAVVTRFWNLGYRALHHDESLHAYYSWGFSTGDIPYVHNPLMHGPFLFHANALIYQLLGVSDATSRFVPAAFGVLLVWLPWLLRGRRFLGSWGALATGFMLLISPAFLYYTRYIRHDPYTAAGALLLAIAVFRYLERPQRRWIVIAFAMVAFLLTNHEIVFAIVLAMVIVLWGALLWTRLRVLIPVHVVAVILAGLDYVLVKDAEPWPAIPWQTASPAETRHFYESVLTHPFVIGLYVVGIVFLVGCAIALRWQVARSDREGSMVEVLFGDAEPNTVAYGVYHALRDPAGLGIGLLVGLGIVVTLFTTLFTNLHGLATATYAPDGTLLYWLGQQDVRRGEQPWFYFFTEGFQYEWLGIVFATAGTILVGVRLVKGLLGRDPGPNLLFNVFNAVWFVFLFLVLSWAGEKMPWLIMHFALPGFLVGGALLNEIVEGALDWFARNRASMSHLRRFRLGMLGTCGGLVLLAVTWFLVAARLTYGQWTQVSAGSVQRELPRWAIHDWWLLAVPPVAALMVIAVAIWTIGPRRAAYATVTAAFVVMSLFQMHQGFRLSFLEGDTALDTLIYNTTSPDVTQMTHDLTAMSRLVYGDDSMVIMYDGCTQWPLNWYFRDFPNRRMISVPPDDPGNMPPVIIGVPAEWDGRCSMPQDIDGYTAQTYVLRWHEPEEAIYRDFAIAPEIPPFRSAWRVEENPHDLTAIAKSIIDSFEQAGTREGQQRLLRLVLFRELPQGLNPYKFRIYVRNDMLPYYNDIRYGE
ncbi:MAG TPA: flippase activity-associated protein Agl23 [Thermomicrobiales bacterium]|nr:flippase activity-associated protein Agl23 [Thermomicrobiales bacterium]